MTWLNHWLDKFSWILMYFYGFYSMQFSYILIHNTLKREQDQENMGKATKALYRSYI